MHSPASTAIDHWNCYLFARRWVRGPNVIDVDCGTGEGTQILGGAPGVKFVLGVSGSRNSLLPEVSRHPHPSAEFIYSDDAMFVPLTRRWNTVVALEFWKHLKCPRTAAFCARHAMPASGRLIVSLPIGETQAQSELHSHCFTVSSARRLVSEFFEITDEYYQANSVTIVATPSQPTGVARDQPTVIALLQVNGGDETCCSATREITELIRCGMHVVVLCDEPQFVPPSICADVFYLPLESTSNPDQPVSPVQLSAACALAQWFDARVIYSSHDSIPLGYALADLSAIPHVIHSRGDPSASKCTGVNRFHNAMLVPHSDFVPNSRNIADGHPSALGSIQEKPSITPTRTDSVEDDVRRFSDAAVSRHECGRVRPGITMENRCGPERSSHLPRILDDTIQLTATTAQYELIVATASDGLSEIPTSDWVSRLSLLASSRTSVLLVVATSKDDVEKSFRHAVRQGGRAGFRLGVVRREEGVNFSFSRELNRAAKFGLSAMPGARGIVCANDDTWPSHIALAGVRSWLDQDGLVGGVCSKGAGGIQDFRRFFHKSVDWKNRMLNADHRIAAFWLYVSREAWIALDGFDERFEGYGCEDTDLSLRAWQLRKHILIDRACFVDHETGSSYSKTKDIGVLREEAIRNFAEKHLMNIEQYHTPLRLKYYRKE
jgi:GT2 family glycosyltransferase